jgi:hypothetical protein
MNALELARLRTLPRDRPTPRVRPEPEPPREYVTVWGGTRDEPSPFPWPERDGIHAAHSSAATCELEGTPLDESRPRRPTAQARKPRKPRASRRRVERPRAPRKKRSRPETPWRGQLIAIAK